MRRPAAAAAWCNRAGGFEPSDWGGVNFHRPSRRAGTRDAEDAEGNLSLGAFREGDIFGFDNDAASCPGSIALASSIYTGGIFQAGMAGAEAEGVGAQKSDNVRKFGAGCGRSIGDPRRTRRDTNVGDRDEVR